MHLTLRTSTHPFATKAGGVVTKFEVLAAAQRLFLCLKLVCAYLRLLFNKFA